MGLEPLTQSRGFFFLDHDLKSPADTLANSYVGDPTRQTASVGQFSQCQRVMTPYQYFDRRLHYYGDDGGGEGGDSYRSYTCSHMF